MQHYRNPYNECVIIISFHTILLFIWESSPSQDLLLHTWMSVNALYALTLSLLLLYNVQLCVTYWSYTQLSVLPINILIIKLEFQSAMRSFFLAPPEGFWGLLLICLHTSKILHSPNLSLKYHHSTAGNQTSVPRISRQT